LFLEEEDFVEGERWLHILLQKHPTGAIALYLGGYVYRKQGKIEQATTTFQKASAAGKEIKQFQRYCDYELGYNSYLCLEWEKAASLLKGFLDSSIPESFRCYAMFQLAMCYEMMNQPVEALDLMKRLLPWVRKGFDYDEFAERKAKKYINYRGFSTFEKQYHVAVILQEACIFDKCLKAIESLIPQAKTDEEKARVFWLQGFCQHRLGRQPEAKKALQMVIEYEKAVIGKDSLLVIPHSLCDLGEILIEEKQLDAAERTLKKAKSYTGYDFAQLLEWRITRNLDRIQNKN